MATYTTRLNLKKPTPNNNEHWSTSDYNDNLDKIENKLAKYTVGTRINYGSGSYIDYVKVGAMVCVNVTYKATDGTIAAWTSLNIGTLPAGYRPAIIQQVRGMVDRTQDDGILVSINSSGVVNIAGRATGFTQTDDVAQASFCYPQYN